MKGTMLAVKKFEPAGGAEMVEVVVPTPKANEILVKIKAASMCGTDRRIFNCEWPFQII